MFDPNILYQIRDNIVANFTNKLRDNSDYDFILSSTPVVDIVSAANPENSLLRTEIEFHDERAEYLKFEAGIEFSFTPEPQHNIAAPTSYAVLVVTEVRPLEILNQAYDKSRVGIHTATANLEQSNLAWLHKYVVAMLTSSVNVVADLLRKETYELHDQAYFKEHKQNQEKKKKEQE